MTISLTTAPVLLWVLALFWVFAIGLIGYVIGRWHGGDS